MSQHPRLAAQLFAKTVRILFPRILELLFARLGQIGERLVCFTMTMHLLVAFDSKGIEGERVITLDGMRREVGEGLFAVADADFDLERAPKRRRPKCTASN